MVISSKAMYDSATVLTETLRFETTRGTIASTAQWETN